VLTALALSSVASSWSSYIVVGVGFSPWRPSCAGKAILDEQPLDAHFTRSFYKHMLGVPVTYHVSAEATACLLADSGTLAKVVLVVMCLGFLCVRIVTGY
jgi:hypothetical protein